MRPRRASRFLLVAFLGASWWPRDAHAEANPRDGVYGRLRGDLDMSVAALASLQKGNANAGLLARLMYLWTAGLYTSMDADLSGPAPARTLGMGVSLRPLFLPRWGSNLETGNASVDLFLDSLTFDLGALGVFRDGDRPRDLGFEFGASVEASLSGRATGLWLGARSALRWPSVRGRDDSPGAQVLCSLTISWHTLLEAHLVDRGDELLH